MEFITQQTKDDISSKFMLSIPTETLSKECKTISIFCPDKSLISSLLMPTETLISIIFSSSSLKMVQLLFPPTTPVPVLEEYTSDFLLKILLVTPFLQMI